MTEEEKAAIYDMFPDADIAYDLDEQLIVYTGRYAENQMPVEDFHDLGGEG